MSEQSGWYIFSVSRREFHPTDFYGMYELIGLARAALLFAVLGAKKIILRRVISHFLFACIGERRASP